MWSTAHVCRTADRRARVAMAEDAFEVELAPKQWLWSLNPAFLGVAPIDYLDTEIGRKPYERF